MEDVGIVYGHLVHFMVFCYILWIFGIVRGYLVYFSLFGILYQEKSGNPVHTRTHPNSTEFRISWCHKFCLPTRRCTFTVA
jgi:hypothetical protein